MNLLGKISLMSIMLWSLIFDRSLFYIYLLIVIIYTGCHYLTKKGSYPGVRRKIAISTWQKIGDPTIQI